MNANDEFVDLCESAPGSVKAPGPVTIKHELVSKADSLPVEGCNKVMLQGRDIDGFEAAVLAAVAKRSAEGNMLVFVRAQGCPGLLTYAAPNMDVESSGVTALKGV